MPAEVQEGARAARLGVDVDNDFEPLLRRRRRTRRSRSPSSSSCSRTPTSSASRRTRTARARRSPGTCSRCSSRKVPVKRMVFHEITRDAIQRAARRHRASIDDAPRRRPGDPPHPRPPLRLRGLARCCGRRSCRGCPPAACSRSRPGSSSSASASAWRSSPPATGTSTATFDAAAAVRSARLVAVDGTRVASGRDFGDDGASCKDDVVAPRRGARAARSPTRCEDAPFTRPLGRARSPTRAARRAPFMTSTLQQEASRKLRFSSQTTMRVAQRLYENGYITYMRTDSTTLSDAGARPRPATRPRELYGAEYVPDAPRRYEQQGQERAGGARGDPSRRRPLPHARRRSHGELTGDELALYELIWKRTSPRRWPTRAGTTVIASSSARRRRRRRATSSSARRGTVITFRGFLAAYEEGRDDDRRRADDDEERRLPHARARATRSTARRARGRQGHDDQPAGALHRGDASSRRSRSAASAARRPTPRSSARSTTAATSSRRARRSCRRSSRSPSTQLLEEHFGRLVDYDFTAAWRTTSTASPPATRSASTWLKRFYFGDATATTAGLHGARHRRTSARSTPRDDQLDPDRPTRRHRGARRPLRAVLERGERARARVPDDLAARRADRREGRGAARAAARRPRRSATTPRPGRDDRRAGRPLRALRHRGARPRDVEGRSRATASLFKTMALETRHARGRAQAAVAAARRRPDGRRRGDHRAERPLRPVPQEGHGDALARDRGAAASTITLEEALAIFAAAEAARRGRGQASRR